MTEEKTVVTRDQSDVPRGPQNLKERLYEKLRMPLWVLDLIIAALVIAFIVVVVVGRQKGAAIPREPAP